MLTVFAGCESGLCIYCLCVGLPKPGVQLTDRFAAGLNINQVIRLIILVSCTAS